MASALRKRMPMVAPFPVATMIDSGVANPSAHGHAMIRTATALTTACASRGGGPTIAQTTNVIAATAITAGTKYAETTSASFWTGARLRCASATIATMRASSVSAPTFSALDHQRAGGVHRGADHTVAGILFDRDRLAGDHRFVHGAHAVDDDTVNRHLLSRSHAQAIAYVNGIEWHILFRSVFTNATRRGGRHTEQLLDRCAGLASGAQLEHLAKENERDDDRRDLEVDAHLSRFVTEAGRKDDLAVASQRRCRRMPPRRRGQ